MKNNKGAVSLLTVMAMTIILVFLIAGGQTRLLLSLHRSRALSDTLILGYHAESKIYDLVARFLGGYAGAFTYPFENSETLSDGTEITTSGEESGRIQTLKVFAKRYFGTSRFEVVREDNTTAENFFDRTEIVMSLDCTGSMGDAACPDCVNTRMDEQKSAVTQFLDTLETIPGHELVKIGISVFAMKADWLYTSYSGDGTPTGTAVRPDSTLSLNQIRDAIRNGFGSSGESDSPACKKLLTYTSVGSGLTFMHDYLRTSEIAGTKQVEVLITDGEPNQRIPYSRCPVNVFCPGDGIYCCPSGSNCYQTNWRCPAGSGTTTCSPHARDFLRCALADTTETWRSEVLGDVLGDSAEPTSTPTPQPTRRPTPTPTPFGAPTATPRPRPSVRPTPTRVPPFPGIRNPDVDVYTVTVMDNPPPEVISIFEMYATRHYNLADANRLREILGQILEEILHRSESFRIQRVVPTPIR
jgi:hypothetical protein